MPKLTVTNQGGQVLATNSSFGRLQPLESRTKVCSVAEVEAMRDKLTSLSRAGLISWSVDPEAEHPDTDFATWEDAQNMSSEAAGSSASQAAIVVGHAIAGDTLADCDFLDTGNGAAIAEAIAAAEAETYDTTVYIRRGTYNLGSDGSPTEVFTLSEGVSIQGEGRTTNIIARSFGDRRLFHKEGRGFIKGMHIETYGAAPGSTGQVLVWFEDGNNDSYIEDIEIMMSTSVEENETLLYAIYTQSCTWMKFKDIRIECSPNSWAPGFHPTFKPILIHGTGHQIDGLHVEIDGAWDPIVLDSLDRARVRNVFSSGDVCLDLRACRLTTISDVVCYVRKTDANGIGVRFQNSEICTLNGAVVHALSGSGSQAQGITLENCDKIAVSGSTIDGPFSQGILFDGTTTNSFANSVVTWGAVQAQRDDGTGNTLIVQGL